MNHQIKAEYAAAEKIYEEILKTEKDQPDAIHLLGLIRAEQERDSEAIQLLERALTLYPGAAHFHHNIAGVYRRVGRLDDAIREFRAAIALKPNYGEAYQGLAEMVRFNAEDPLVEKITEQLSDTGLEDPARAYFHFAAGKMNDDIGRYSLAFKHYTQGNRLSHRPYDSKMFRVQVKDTIYVHSRALRESLGQSATDGGSAGSDSAGSDSEVPTFIVGMPRSGTTLVEQILASHSKVFGAGELNDMKYIAAVAERSSGITFPNCVPAIPAGDYRKLGDEYLRRIVPLARGAPVERIIDKHPLNFQFVGLILSMFPKARIIHTVRHPLDTCLSCFFQNFTKGQNYSFDLMTLAHFYNDYRRLMEHWESVYGDRIYTVNYESLIGDQEAQTRGLLEFMGLDFEPGCIEFHKTERKVSTASFMQVRTPLYASSQRRWMNYAGELEPLARVIGLKIERPVTISGAASVLS